MKKHAILKKIAVVVSMLLFGILVVGTVIAFENSSKVSSALNAQTFEIVNNEDSDADTEYYKSEYSKLGDLINAGAKKTEEVMSEGAVLLKNDSNALPLPETARNVSVFGTTSADPVYGGTGSGSVATAQAVNLTKGFEDAGLVMNPTLKENYSSKDVWYSSTYRRSSKGWGGSGGRSINDVPWDVVDEAAGSTFADYSDAAIYVVGRIGGEGSDLNSKSLDGIDNNDGLGKDYLGLNANERSMLQGLSDARESGEFDRLIVIINSASPLEMEWLDDYKVDSVLWVGALGQNGAAAVGKLLTGEYDPSGSLPDTFWYDNAANPVNVNFGYWLYPNAEELGVSVAEGNMFVPEPTLAAYVVYQEGMYLGYKYTETRYEDYVMGTRNTGDFDYDATVAYTFGHGLSYAEFEYSDFSVRKTGDRTYELSVKVTNTSDKYSGKHAVQVYVSKPYGDYARTNNIQVPSVELIDFGKTALLGPGKSETVTIPVDEKFFASYDAYGAGTYVLMPGDYYLTIGKDAHDAVNNVLAAKGYTPSNTDNRMDAAGDTDLVFETTLSFDDDKYSVSDSVSSLDGQTHNTIGNLFDFGDINRYSGRGTNSVEYYDRDNWTGTVSLDIVNGHPELVMTEQMAMEIYAQTPEELRAEVPDKYHQPIPKDDVAYPTYGNADEEPQLKLIDMMYDSEGNEISYFDPAWDTFMDQLTWDETARLVTEGYHLTAGIDRIVKVETNDENGPNGFNRTYNGSQLGLYYRTEKAKGNVDGDGNLTDAADPDGAKRTTAFPANGILAATFNKQLVYEAGKIIGEDGIWSGHSGLYGIGANIHRSPYLGRMAEYYSEDGMLTGLIAAWECKGIEEKGVHVYNKHCVVNDQETCRHGVCVWVSEQALREIYLRAFELPITMGGAYNTMASFARIGTISGSACSALGTDFLRGECGMKGIIVTDCYTDMDGSQGSDPYYEHAYGVYYGGCDIPDGNEPFERNDFEMFKTGYGKMAWAMRESAKRVLYQALHSNAMNGISSETRIVQLTPWWQTALISIDIVLGVLFVASLAWIAVGMVLERRKGVTA